MSGSSLCREAAATQVWNLTTSTQENRESQRFNEPDLLESEGYLNRGLRRLGG